MKILIMALVLILPGGCAIAPPGSYDTYRPYYASPPCPPPPPPVYGACCRRNWSGDFYGPPHSGRGHGHHHGGGRPGR